MTTSPSPLDMKPASGPYGTTPIALAKIYYETKTDEGISLEVSTWSVGRNNEECVKAWRSLKLNCNKIATRVDFVVSLA